MNLRDLTFLSEVDQLGAHCDWPIPKWGCLIGVDKLEILINWGGGLGRIQKTWPLAKRGCLIGGDILILYTHYVDRL